MRFYGWAGGLLTGGAIHLALWDAGIGGGPLFILGLAALGYVLGDIAAKLSE